MGTCVHLSRSLPSNSWWQTMAGWQVLSRPSAAEGGGRRPAFTRTATQPYSATEVDGWQHKAQPGVSKPGRSTQDILFAWCHSNPEVGPAFLAQFIPVLETQRPQAGGNRLHPIAKRLLDEFGDRED